MNKILIILRIMLIVAAGIVIGLIIFNNNQATDNNIIDNQNNILATNVEEEFEVVETSVGEERTTPNTLIIYKTYYTKCKHFIQRYADIDAALVNLTEKEFKEKTRGWNIERFSAEEIELSKEEEAFCNEHYKLRLENNVIVIYKIDEAGVENEYEQTEITTEYLTNEDILKLTTGIEVYGKENLSNTIEDYE